MEIIRYLCAVFYRRKIILALLETCGGTLSAINFQKLLFLVTRKQEIKTFDFVPYRYGCFSFQANQDIATLKTYGYVSLNDNDIKLEKNENCYSQLTLFDIQYVSEIKEQFASMSQTDLIRYTYVNYPYYATKSAIAEKVLSEDEMQKVRQQIRNLSETVLFTIGYEGISLETYINKLIVNDIKILCDVRKNAFSQKYGFSKSQLKTACEGVGIQYLHIPNLGIVSEKRQTLNTQADYDALFVDYQNTVLQQNARDITYLLYLLKESQRIALTCFEANINQCHRKYLAEAVTNLPDFNYQLKHI
jgi:uncharacterized protein (DUF488 family)